jgi:hypothetical protein
MSHALAWAALATWVAAAVIATPMAGWLLLRAGRRDWRLVVLAVFLAAELVWVGWVARNGSDVLLERPAGAGLPAWLGWVVGLAGLAALPSALRSGSGDGLRRDPDRVTALACGFFGLGYLLQAIARAVQSGPL